MLSTRTILCSVKEVPNTWIFEYYLNMLEKLDGKDIKLKSVFNPHDSVPSMFIYYGKDGKYKYKDFSSGKSGSAVDLVMELYNLSYYEASNKIMADYNSYLMQGDYSIDEFKKYSRYKVSDYEARHWTTLDQKYWTKYYISSKMLDDYNVMPLSYYKMSKDTGEEIIIKGHMIYGYFKSDGLLYKIYQPGVKNKKFLKVRNHIQGIDQLTYTKPNLVIHSSLKDIMSFNRLGFKTIECIAPDSENSIISEATFYELNEKYNTIITIFDNDEAGKKAIAKYKERYGLNGFALNLEKDISDSIKQYGLQQVRNELEPLLIENIYTNRRCPQETLT